MKSEALSRLGAVSKVRKGAQGNDLSLRGFKRDDLSVTVDGNRLVAVDMVASDGIVHVIDGVLLPPAVELAAVHAGHARLRPAARRGAVRRARARAGSARARRRRCGGAAGPAVPRERNPHKP